MIAIGSAARGLGGGGQAYEEGGHDHQTHSPAARRQSRRDRPARHPQRPRDGHFHGGDLRGRRRRRALRARCGHGHRLERNHLGADLPESRQGAGRLPPRGCRCRPPGLRVPLRERGLRQGRGECGNALGGAVAGSHRADGRQAGGEARDHGSRGAHAAGHRTEGRRGFPSRRAADRLSGAGEGIRRRRWARHAGGGVAGRA